MPENKKKNVDGSKRRKVSLPGLLYTKAADSKARKEMKSTVPAKPKKCVPVRSKKSESGISSPIKATPSKATPPKSAPEKAPAKKAPGKKKTAAKSETEKPAVPAKAEAKAAVKKPAAKKKTAVRKPEAKTAKAKPADKESNYAKAPRKRGFVFCHVRP